MSRTTSFSLTVCLLATGSILLSSCDDKASFSVARSPQVAAPEAPAEPDAPAQPAEADAGSGISDPSPAEAAADPLDTEDVQGASECGQYEGFG